MTCSPVPCSFGASICAARTSRLELHVEPALPGVRGDPNQLLQVFYNIISNAGDSMEESGGGSLSIRSGRTRSSVVIDFSDSGPGIRQPELVFDPFYTTKPVGKGTGLGLASATASYRNTAAKSPASTATKAARLSASNFPRVPAMLPLREIPLATVHAATGENGETA